MIERSRRPLRAVMRATLLLMLGTVSVRAQSDTGGKAAPAGVKKEPPQLTIPEPAAMAPVTASEQEQNAFMMKSARAAWSYVNRETTRKGFVGATKTYPFLTVWDMASGMGSAYSARELGIISKAQYTRYVERTLASIEKLTLYDGATFNRLYSANTGAMVDSKGNPSQTGMGFSSLDHGRLLVWLKIVGESDPTLAARSQRIVNRLSMARLTANGYLQGESFKGSTDGVAQAYQEGRVGYEQYAAEGFNLWGAPVWNARYFYINGRPIDIYGKTLVTDVRGHDVMTSEPFVMMGLELGFPGSVWKNLTLQTLAVQEERFKRTGIVTMVTEDAIPVPPTYFYYYLIHQDGKPFVVSTVTGTVNDSFPRWVSAKAAFGYHALHPTDYTWRALQAVKYAGNAGGWAAGVFEGTQRSTGTYNLNTAALVLESAAYMKRQCPLIKKSCSG